jgi:rRNA small subunit pseudouridine methyltransferase Nep1
VKLSVVLAESALELVPSELLKTPSVRKEAERRGVDPAAMLLDRSLHHAAMLKLKEGYKRGRPDLVHVSLLSLTGTPLYLNDALKIYVHTRGDLVLEIKEGTRLPKSYARFRGLVEQALRENGAGDLIKTYKASLGELLRRLKPDWVCGLSTEGAMVGLEELSLELVARKNPFVVIGGFPRGHFSEETLAAVDKLVRIHSMPLEAQVVAARLVYEVERQLEEKRKD